MPGKSKGKRIRYLQMEHSLALGALVAADLIKGDFSQVMDEKVFALWAKGAWAIDTATAGEGGITCGFSHSSYTDAQVEECIEQALSWDAGNKVAQEQRRRKVRRVGDIVWRDSTSGSMEQGKSQFTKLMFNIEIGETLATWARTRTLLTTGAVLTFSGIIAVRPS